MLAFSHSLDHELFHDRAVVVNLLAEELLILGAVSWSEIAFATS